MQARVLLALLVLYLAAMAAAYGVIIHKARAQFGDDYAYVAPRIGWFPSTSGKFKKLVCSDSPFIIRPDKILLTNALNDARIDMWRPWDIPIHFGVLKDGQLHHWSFGAFDFVAPVDSFAFNVAAQRCRGGRELE
ncbi:hypothetical protein [Azorhizobium oxalatiphilum]|uniref:hypothetical protein n=1 Tax=Azorhizobium oxalatiphilum TaxID=980631 RepID=UPI001664F4FF|nr:hypothetical protein [Azorhizobium oxalatiphilum]